MQLAITSFVLAAMLPFVLADCQNSGGVANGECVKFYGNSECKGSPIGSYKPTCGGNCFQYNSFGSVFVSGDGTYGTDCVLYADDNCSVEQTVSLRPGDISVLTRVAYQDTGNVVTGSGKCAAAPNAKSMKCFYRC